jgi:PAS domain S-box-containing protein
MRDSGDEAQDADLSLPPESKVGPAIRSVDWSATSAGALKEWPVELRAVVRLMLNSKFPMFVAWGEELTFIYNDAYAEILGAKHPRAMGQPFEEIWSEIWDDIRPFVDRALEGEASWLEDLPLTMNRHGYDEQTYFTFSYSPVHREDGKVAGMFCSCTETTKKVVAEQEIAAQRNRLMRMFEQAPGFMAMLRGPEHRFELANGAYHHLIGRQELLGKTAREVLPEVEDQGFFETLDEVYREGRPFNARAMPITLRRGVDGSPDKRFLDFVYQPVSDANGDVTGIFVEGYDVTERKQAEDHQLLLIDELNHRVKNMLAIVQGIAMQTLKGDAAAPQARAALEQRFGALAATHKLLTRGNWTDVAILNVVSGAVEPFQDGEDRISFAGPALTIAPKTAITLALAVHELATNAAKYGALSNEVGTVGINWAVSKDKEGEPRWEFTWAESGGPVVEQPRRRGFGTRMIERGLAAELGGKVALAFNPEGVVCSVFAPLARVQA